MACRLFDTKPLSEPMLAYCQSNHKEHVAEILFQTLWFHKINLEISFAKWCPYSLRIIVLNTLYDDDGDLENIFC